MVPIAEIGTTFVSILPSAAGFGRKLDSQVGGQMAASGKKSGKTFGSTFGTAVKGTLAALGIAQIASKAIAFVGDSLAEGREAEKIGARTANVIESMGLSAKVTAGQIGDLSTAISNKTGIDDEAIQAGANMLLTFKNVAASAGDANGVFAQATGLVTDLSTAMGTSMKSASIQLGKALNDPVKGLTALGRAGIQFTADQQTQIKALVASGDTMKAQGIILGEVSAQFGGAAEAMATPSDKARVAVANLKEQIGTALIPVVNTLATFMVTTGIPALSAFATGIGKSAKFIGDHKTAVLTLTGALTALIVVTKLHTLSLAISAAGGLLPFLKATKLVTAATKVYTAFQWLLNAALTANPIGLVIVALVALGAGLVIAYKKSETFRNIVDGAFSAVRGFIGSLDNKVSDFIAKWQSRWDTAVAVVKAVPGTISAVFSGLGTVLYNAGVSIIAQFAAGIRAKMDDAIDAVKDGLSIIAGLLPGSPIKEGPLKSWNNGGAGKRLMELLAKGIRDGAPAAKTAFENFTDSLVDNWGKALDKARERLQGAQSVLAGLMDDAAAMRDSVASAFSSDLFSSETLTDFLTGGLAELTKLATVRDAMESLRRQGASAEFLAALGQSGNADLTLQLAADPAGLAQAQAIYEQQQTLSQEIGQSVADANFKAAITAQTEEVHQLRMDLLNVVPSSIGDAVGRALNGTSANAKRDSRPGRPLVTAA